MTDSYFLKKYRGLKPLETLLAIIGFLLVGLFFLGCFSYLDYRAVNNALRYCGVSSLGLDAPSSSSSSPPAAALSRNERLGFLDEGGDGCDVFDGNWVWDDSYPLYQDKDCPFLDNGYRCLEHGRPDSFYTKWRWQPKDCNLPRFDARNMLDMLRNRRVVFVGDSIGRNQWSSLLCMLASAITDNTSIKRVTKGKAFRMFVFKDYNFTFEYYRAPYLVFRGHALPGAPEQVKSTIRLDRLSSTSKQWRDADVLVFNSGHWWTPHKTTTEGCYFQEGNEVKMEMTVDQAFQRSIETLIDWIGSEVNMSKTQVIFRSYSPVHFRNGAWNTGGQCHVETLPELGPLPNTTEHYVRMVSEVLSKHWKEPAVMKLDLLNVTNMTWRRKDGHMSLYHQWLGRWPAPLNHQDCSHWCLPGVPDSWNELLYALLLKRDSLRKPKYSPSQASQPS